jgi:hypothetical protein
VGAVIINGVESLIFFTSSRLSSSKKLQPIRREDLALIFSIKRYQKFLFGHKFSLITDHQPLQHIFNTNEDLTAKRQGKREVGPPNG